MPSLNDFYIPHSNYFELPMVFGVSYALLVVCSMFLLAFFFKDNRRKEIAIVLICFLAIVSIIVQLIGQWGYKAKLGQLLSHKSFIQRENVYFGSAFGLAYCAQNKLSGKSYQGEFISSFDHSYIFPFYFRYELYPVINFTSNNYRPQARVCFYSDQCAKVPEDFHLICHAQSGYIALRGEPNVQDHHSL